MFVATIKVAFNLKFVFVGQYMDEWIGLSQIITQQHG